MKVLLKSATLIDPQSKHHKKKRDVLIERGVITKIAATITDPKAKTISRKDLHLSQGWFDPSVSFGEPGFEERETIDNGLQTAACGGFTAVGINANTHPVTDSKSHVKFLKSKAYNHAVSAYPIGALTVGSNGTDLAELFDMHSQGAISFYDYKKPIAKADLLKIALQYAQNFDGLVQSFPQEQSMATQGVANEELNATQLGLKGIPAVSEEIQLVRDLQILEYTGGRLHIPTISTAKSVQLIKEAKKKGLDVSCSVSINNLCLTDDQLSEFDTHFKVMPPLRTQKDANALIKGLKDGVIDGVTSDHDPIDIEHKRTEFDHALFGSIGLESCFGALLGVIDLETAIQALTGLKFAFGVDQSGLKEGDTANLTLFSPQPEWVFTMASIVSTSKNSAMLGKAMKGTVYGIINNNQVVLNG